MACTDPNHKLKKKGPCKVCKGCVYCPPQTTECQHKRSKVGRPTAQDESQSRKRVRTKDGAQLEDLGSLLEQARGGGTVENGVYKDSMEQLVTLLGLPKGKLSAREGSGSSSAAYDSAIRLHEIIQAVIHVFFRGKQAQSSVMHILLKKMIEDHDTDSIEPGQIAKHSRLSDSMMKLLKGCSGDARSVCLSTLFSAFDSVTANNVMSHHGLPTVGQRGITKLRNEYRLLERGESIGSAARNRTSRISEAMVSDALVFLESYCVLLGVPRTTAKFGGHSVVIPRMERAVTASYLWNMYRTGGQNDKGTSSEPRTGLQKRRTTRLGKGEFFNLVKAITNPPTRDNETNVAAGLHEQMVVASTTRTIFGQEEDFYTVCDRLSVIFAKLTEQCGWNNESVVQVKQLEDAVLWSEHFVRHELRSHLNTTKHGTTDVLHCVLHAVGFQCDHDHSSSCSECIRLWNIDQLLKQLHDAFRKSRLSAHNMATMDDGANIANVDPGLLQQLKLLLDEFSSKLCIVKQGIALQEWQRARLVDVLHELPQASNQAVLVLELVQFSTPVKSPKVNDDKLPIRGDDGNLSVLSCALIQTENPNNTLNVNFFDLVFSSMQHPILHTALLETLIGVVKSQVNTLEQVILVSKHEDCLFTYDEFPTMLAALNMSFAKKKISVSRCLFTLDSFPEQVLGLHVAGVHRRVRKYVQQGNEIGNPAEMAKALCNSRGGLSNTSTVHVDVHQYRFDNVTESLSSFLSIQNFSRVLDIVLLQPLRSGECEEEQQQHHCPTVVLSEVGLLAMSGGDIQQQTSTCLVVELGRKGEVCMEDVVDQLIEDELLFGCQVTSIESSTRSSDMHRKNLNTARDLVTPMLMRAAALDDDSSDDEELEHQLADASDQDESSNKVGFSQLYRCGKCRRVYRVLASMKAHEEQCKGARSKQQVFVSAVEQWANKVISTPPHVNRVSSDDINMLDDMIAQEWTTELCHNKAFLGWAVSTSTTGDHHNDVSERVGQDDDMLTGDGALEVRHSGRDDCERTNTNEFQGGHSLISQQHELDDSDTFQGHTVPPV